MAKIKVKDLSPGMTLTADVRDPNGRFLLGDGCELTDKHIKALHAWGVISVEVADSDIPEDQQHSNISPEAMAAIEKDIKARFIHNNLEVPFIEELIQETVKFFAEKLEY